MSGQAKISSIDALEAFRADLIRYIDKARVALEDMEGDVRRTQTWLDTDRKQYWERELREWMKKLHQAAQELYSANLTNPQASNAFQKMAVVKARRGVEEAVAKLRVVKKWRQSFETRAAPLLRQLDPLFQLVGQQLPKGVHSLGESIAALQAYAEKFTPAVAPMPSPPLETGGGP